MIINSDDALFPQLPETLCQNRLDAGVALPMGILDVDVSSGRALEVHQAH